MAQNQQPESAALEHASDHLLAARAKDGDRRAFAALIRRYGPRLRDYTSRTVGDAESHHVVQETFLTAWHQLDSLTESADVEAWLLRITTQKLLEIPHGQQISATTTAPS